MTIVRSLRVVIEMPEACDGIPDACCWFEQFEQRVNDMGGKIGSWGIMEEEIE